MINLAKFSVIGRIGKVTERENVTYVSIASDYQRKVNGEWTTETNWTGITVFSDNLRKRFSNGGGRVGNLVTVEGRIQQNSHDKDGQTHYNTDLIATDLEVLHFAKKKD